MTEYMRVAGQLPREIAAELCALPDEEKKRIQEIRLRENGYLTVFDGRSCRFVGRGKSGLCPPAGAPRIGEALLHEAFLTLCGYSLQAHEQELRNGFITTAQGDRIGTAFSAAVDECGVTVRRITSLNVRISRDIVGCAAALVQAVDFLHGVLLCGEPSSGKTTLLRDAVRQLAQRGNKVVVIDERGEIASGRELGGSCDVLAGIPKAEAIRMAVRTLSPQVVACDEIGSLAEAEQIAEGLRCGASFVATAHCGSGDDVFRSPVIRRLMDTGAFARIALLYGCDRPGTVEKIVTREDYHAESGGRGDRLYSGGAVGLFPSGGAGA